MGTPPAAVVARPDWLLVPASLGRALPSRVVLEPSLPVDLVLAGGLRVETGARLWLISEPAPRAGESVAWARTATSPWEVQSAWVGRAQLLLDLDGGAMGWRCARRRGDEVFEWLALGGAAANVDPLTGIDLPRGAELPRQDLHRRREARRFVDELGPGDREALVLSGALGPGFWRSAVETRSILPSLLLGNAALARMPDRLRRPWLRLQARCLGRGQK
jgi:hypothetical protein